MSYNVIVKSGLLLWSQQVVGANRFKIRSEAEKLKRLTGIPFCAAYWLSLKQGTGNRGTGNGERGTGNGERGTGNGESLK